ncbi:hypothetical protein PVAND_011414 [Polypedilum vanderplanki]|uniref:protein-serine/threonine phosphatase n=1 Tax=Polypedilum vanderplanki TaxID=319348 RepID=A0A9J6CKC0_POLVA|nr:hypothetical protein PVAND_011414 [Polypedilum vanderplanki]
MDSIITQVNREDEQLNAFNDKGNVEESVTKTKSKRRIWTQYICCWRQNSLSSRSKNGGGSGSSLDGGLSTQTIGQSAGITCNSSQNRYLLPQVRHSDMHKKCMVIDLDETLVHSSFKPIPNADFIVPVEIDGTIHQVYVLKRPYVDEFLKKMGELYECVLFTASLSKYADPVADLLDQWNVFRARLFRESCVYHGGNYVKDLNKLGRDLQKIVIVDNSPASYIFHPENAVPVKSWFDDTTDTELLELIPLFEKLSKVDSVYTILSSKNGNSNSNLITTLTSSSSIVTSSQQHIEDT